MWQHREVQERFITAMGLLSGLCLVLFFLRIAMTGVVRYWFVPENLALAWLSFVFGWLLYLGLTKRRWLSWQNIVLSILWLGFLPNSWYVLTDFVHLSPTSEISQIYDIVLMSSLTLCGFILGFTSLYMMHNEFLKRRSLRASHVTVAAILLLSSFAIYLGRDLRWSTWDVVANPSGIILDVSDRVIDPFGHPRAFNVTALFFIFLGAIYLAIWILFRPKTPKKAR
jgi:uncharacterized membrane protein